MKLCFTNGLEVGKLYRLHKTHQFFIDNNKHFGWLKGEDLVLVLKLNYVQNNFIDNFECLSTNGKILIAANYLENITPWELVA